MISETDCAYMAGMIDGEGCLTITVRKPRKFGLAPVHECVLAVSNNNKDMLDQLQTIFGGSVTKPSKNGGYALRFSGRALDNILLRCAKYSKGKADQFSILAEFRGHKTSGPLTQESIEFREELRQKIMSLHGGRRDKRRVRLPASRVPSALPRLSQSRWAKSIRAQQQHGGTSPACDEAPATILDAGS